MTGRTLIKHSLLSLAAAMFGALLPAAALAATGPAFTLTTPATATFPLTAAGATSTAQNIVLTTTRAVTISSVAIASSINGHQEFAAGTMTGCTVGSAAASGATCTIPVTFSPYYTGVRQGALTVTDSTGLVYTVGLSGFGDGPQTLLTPTSINTTGGSSPGPYYAGDGGAVASGRFGFPEGVFIDASNNIYIADFSTNNVRVVYQAGAALACLIELEEPTLFGLSNGATSCAGATSAPVAGNLYTLAGDLTAYTSTSSTHTTGSTTNVIAASTGATTLFSPAGVTVDSAGNVIIANYGSFSVRVIYSGGDSMACLIEVENPTLFGLSSTATSCAGATSAPQQGFIYSLANTTGTAGITGDGAKASAAAMANLYAVAISRDGDIYVTDNSVQAARTARIRVIYNGGTAAAALIAATNPGTTAVYGNIYKIAGGTQISGGDGGIATSGGLLFSRGVAVDSDGDVLFTDYNGVGTSFTNEGKVRVVYNGGATMGNLIKLENPSVTPVVGYLYTLAGNAGTVGTTGTGDGGLASAAQFVLPYGLAVDAAGDIFVNDYTDRIIRKINAADGIIHTYAGTAGSQGTTLGNSLTTGKLWDPFGIAIGSSGTVIIGDYGIYRVRNVDITAAAITFAPVAIGSTGSPTYVYLMNQGTKPATLASFVATTNFTVLPLGTSSTSLYALDCTKITTLPAGQTCAVAVALQPNTGGNLTGTLTITDNSNGGTATKHSVSLSGSSGIQTQVTLTSSANPTNAGNTVTYTAVVAPVAGQDLTGAPTLIGTVAFTDGSTAIPGSPVAIDSTGTATITSALIPGGTHTIKAVFTPDASINTSYAGATATLSEVATALATTTTLTSSAPNADPGANVTLTATVVLNSGQTIPPGTPSLAGTVTFTDTFNTTTTVIASNVAINASGVATASINTLAVGTHNISATFTPSSVFYSNSTGTLAQIVSAPTFTATTTSYGVAVPTGGTVAVPFSINSFGAYKGTVTGGCSGLPANVTCSFSPKSITFTGADNAVAETVTIGTTNQTSSNSTHSGRNAAELAGLLGAALLLFVPRRRRLGLALMAIFTLALSTGLSGCSSSTPTASRGTFNINVTFTDGATPITNVITVSVVGNPGN